MHFVSEKKKMQFPYKIRLPLYMHVNNMVIILFLWEPDFLNK